MTSNELGGAVQNNVGAKKERRLEYWSHESVVDHDETVGILGFGQRRCQGDIGNAQSWICRTLQVQNIQTWSFFNRTTKFVGVAGVGPLRGNIQSVGTDSRQEKVGPSVDRIRIHDMTSSGDQSHDGSTNGTHSTRKRVTIVGPTFQGHKFVFNDLHIWIVQSGIDQTRWLAVISFQSVGTFEEELSLFRSGKNKGRRLEDGWFDGSFREIAVIASMNDGRTGMEFSQGIFVGTACHMNGIFPSRAAALVADACSWGGRLLLFFILLVFDIAYTRDERRGVVLRSAGLCRHGNFRMEERMFVP
mmetsp:Transcript_17862/g.31244  ORF Transcript_17862/g.31244 Transcript_17862/m.31244 type:complete len:303 (+) Transcript_17862:478-1386(+)